MLGEEGGTPRATSARAREVLNKLERAYLAAIRAIALIAATLLVLYAIWLAISGIYKSSKDVDSVKEMPAVVSAEEVTQIDLNKITKTSDNANSDPFAVQRGYYADFAKRYHALFEAKFQPFKRPEDKPLDQKAFDARYVRADDRVEAIREGAINFRQDQSDLESLLKVMTVVSSSRPTIDRLQAYKSAKRNRVTRTVSGTREETYCSYYGYFIDECISYDTRTVPYSRNIEEMKLPDGVISHIDLLGAYQERYLSMLAERRRTNAAMAQGEREDIVADNLDGEARLWTAVRVVGGFVVLMFLFLLIAVERHQRKIAASVASD